MNKRLKNISRILPAVVTAMMLLFMTAAGAWAEGTQEPPKKAGLATIDRKRVIKWLPGKVIVN